MNNLRHFSHSTISRGGAETVAGRLSVVRAAFVLEEHLGHQTYAQNLRRFLPESNRVKVDWIPITYTSPRAPWQRLPILPSRLRGALVGRYQVRKGLNSNRHDIYFFNTQVPAALAGRIVDRKPYLLATDITPRQYDSMAGEYGHRADGPGLIADLKHRVNVRLFRNACRLLPWSGWAAESLIADYGAVPERIEVLPPGVDLDCWKPVEKPAGDRIRILFVGGDFYRKGGDKLLEVYAGLRSKKLELVVVTRTKLDPPPGVKIYADLQPNSEALIQLYQTSDLFVLPSQAEAFGIAAIEASACGLPVVASKVGGLRDIVQNGNTGFLYRPGEHQELAEYVRRLVEDPVLRQRFGNAARTRAERYFNARKNVARLTKILVDVVQQGDHCV